MGDLNDDRKEGIESRTLACNMGGGSFRIRTLANVRAEMRNGNARILSGPCHDWQRSGEATHGVKLLPLR